MEKECWGPNSSETCATVFTLICIKGACFKVISKGQRMKFEIEKEGKVVDKPNVLQSLCSSDRLVSVLQRIQDEQQGVNELEISSNGSNAFDLSVLLIC